MTTERKSLTAGSPRSAGKKGSVGSFFSGLIGEFKKVVWPSRKDMTRLTLIVIIITATLGIILGAIDYGFEALVTFLSKAGV